MPSESGSIDALAFCPGGNLLADVSYNGTVAVLSLANPPAPPRAATVRTVIARR